MTASPVRMIRCIVRYLLSLMLSECICLKNYDDAEDSIALTISSNYLLCGSYLQVLFCVGNLYYLVVVIIRLTINY